MTDREGPGGFIFQEPLTKVESCPKCGDVLLSDSKFCRCCGHPILASAPEETTADGLQFLCSKYSALITRLREEVLAHQQAEAEARHLERRLKEEAQAWSEEKEQLMREQLRLREEMEALRAQATTRPRKDGLCQRCGREGIASCGEAQLREPLTDSALERRSLEVRPTGEKMWQQLQAQEKQHKQMMILLDEHSQLKAEARDAQDELSACRDHLARWRRKAQDLETQKMTAQRGREDAEKKARCVQEEMRQALRSCSLAKSRQKEAERQAKQEEAQAKDLEERLKALRYDSRLNARRANGAAGRLASAEAAEAHAAQLEYRVQELQRQLSLAREQGEELRVGNQRLEEAEQRAVLRNGEVLGELRAAEALSSSSTARVKELEVQLLSAREALAQAENERANQSSWTQRLGHDLADARAKEQEAQLQQAQLSQELREAQRRLEQLVGGTTTPGELSRCKQRLAELEEVCGRQEAELAEERRARERCHMEAVKSGEKLRLARAQGAQMKEKVKSLEEAELRYPSRFPPRSAKTSLPRQPPRSQSAPRRLAAEPLAAQPREAPRWSWEEEPRAALPQAEPQEAAVSLAAMLPKAPNLPLEALLHEGHWTAEPLAPEAFQSAS